MNKKMRTVLFAFIATLGSLSMVACGGGGGGGSSSGGSGGSGGGTGGSGFEAPDTADLENESLLFTFADTTVLELVYYADTTTVQTEPNTGKSFTISYSSGKFGGNTDAKDGVFDIEEGPTAEPDAYELNVIWDSATSGTFTGLYYPDTFDRTTSTSVSGTFTIR
jgi:hypothetical protein